jgi:serine 3-dehydrogenase (NADP+)
MNKEVRSFAGGRDVAGRTEGEVAIVTGAANGIGEAVAMALADDGYRLLLLDNDAPALTDLAERLDAAGAAVEPCVVDLRDAPTLSDELRERIASLRATGATLVALVNNAGVGGWKSVEETSASDWDAILDVNLRGAFLVTKEVVPLFKARRQGTIVTIASDSAEFSFPQRSAYCASKHGLVGFSNALREELRSFGIRVSLVYMSRVDTAFNGGARGTRPDVLHPADVARVVRFIVSQPSLVELREVKMTSVATSYGPYEVRS